MAGAFSGHLISSYHTVNRSMAQKAFGQFSPSSSRMVTQGAMSFDSQMHGNAQQSPHLLSFDDSPSYMDMSEDTAVKIAQLQAKLNQKLGPEYISQRPGPGGGPKLTYAEGWKIINLANEVFGFNGWSSNIVTLTTDFIDYNEESHRYTVGATAVIRVTLRDGVFHEDIGYGMLENSKSKGGALDKCKKEAVTDALKRALRNFGNLLGNCLYDKAYTQEVVKIKVPPAKFNKDELYRRPEFEERKPNIQVSPSNAQIAPASNAAKGPTGNTNNFTAETRPTSFPVKQEALANARSLPSVPQHTRPDTTMADPSAHQVPQLQSIPKTGLNTPIQTPAQRVLNPARPQQEHNFDSPLQPPNQQHQRQDRQAASGNHPLPKSNLNNQTVQQTNIPGAMGPPAHNDTKVEIPEADESYNMNSDDESFLAAVDLGEGDLGRPIDFEEGTGAENNSDASFETSDPRQRTNSASNHTLQKSGARIPPQNHLGPSGAASWNLRQQRENAQADASTSSGKPPGTGSCPIRPGPQSHNGGTNISNGTAGPSNSDNNKRLSTPMGGFHFPPGVNPPQIQQSAAVPQQYAQRFPSAVAGPTNKFSLKRNADAMQPSDTSGLPKRPPPGMGMGLQRQQQQNALGLPWREPLARLDVNEGGEVKRVKR